MMTVLTRASNNQPVTLGKQIASSGEGEVWETNLSSILAKIYHNPTPERIEKLKAMLANPPVDPMASQNHISIAFPQDLLKDGSGAYIGFLMPAIRESRELPTVYHPGLRKKKAPGFNWYYLHVTARNTAWIIQAIHEKGYVLGDIKPQNILVNDRALVAVIDTDSFQVRDSRTGEVYRCTVGSEGFTPVELLGKDFSTTDQTEIHARFRLGVLIHYLLFGYHPFSGEWTGAGDSPEQTELIRKGFWYGGQNSLIRPSQNTISLDVVYPEIKCCFLKCFNDGHTSPHLRPTAEDWCNALRVAIDDLTICGKVDSHHYSKSYSKCYWCERKTKLGVDIFLAVSSTANIPTNTTPSKAALVDKILQGHSDSVLSIAISLDGKTLVSGSGDRTIKVWNLAAGQVVHTLKAYGRIKSLTGGINLAAGQVVHTLKGHLMWVWSVAISPDGQTLASGSGDKTIKIWNLATGQELHTLKRHSSRIVSLAISPNGQTLVSGSWDNTIKVWNLATGQEVRTLYGHFKPVLSVTISPDGKTLISGGGDKTIKVWNLATGQELHTLYGHSDSVWSVAISPDGKTFVSGSGDKTIKIWNLSTGKELCTLNGHPCSVFSVAISPDQQTLISGSHDNTVRVWDFATKRQLCTLNAHSAPVSSVAFSPDGQTFVSCSYDKTIRIWQTSLYSRSKGSHLQPSASTASQTTTPIRTRATGQQPHLRPSASKTPPNTPSRIQTSGKNVSLNTINTSSQTSKKSDWNPFFSVLFTSISTVLTVVFILYLFRVAADSRSFELMGLALLLLVLSPVIVIYSPMLFFLIFGHNKP